MSEQAKPSDQPEVSSWLWLSAVSLLVIVLATALGLVAALAVGWRSLIPRRAPDWTGADLTWAYHGDGTATATQGDYRIRLLQPRQRGWANTVPSMADFDVELDVRAIATNQDAGFGLLYRYQDAGNYYRFGVGSDGYYSIDVIRDGELAPFREWQQWPHVRRGENANRLRVRCLGSLCRFFINGEFAAEISDDAFLDGSLGVWAQNYSNNSLEVIFEEIRLWLLD